MVNLHLQLHKTMLHFCKIKGCVFFVVTVEVEDVPELKEPELPIIPNYLSNPPFMYSKMDNKSEIIHGQHNGQNGSGDSVEDAQTDSVSPSPTDGIQTSQSLVSESSSPENPAVNHSQASEFIPVHEQNGASSPASSPHSHAVVNCTVPMDLSVEPHLVNHADYPHAVAHNGTMCSSPLASPCPNLASSGGGGSQVQAQVASANQSINRQASVPQQLSYNQASGPMPAFQPFFFTSTFPVNVQGGFFCVLHKVNNI